MESVLPYNTLQIWDQHCPITHCKSCTLCKKVKVWTITRVMIHAIILWNLMTSRNSVLHRHLFGYIIVNLSFKCELNIFTLRLPSKIFVQLKYQKIRYIRNTRILGCCLVTHSCVNCRHFQQTHTLFSYLQPANNSWYLLKYVPFCCTRDQNTLCQQLFQVGYKKFKSYIGCKAPSTTVQAILSTMSTTCSLLVCREAGI
jgi:hypothetical protein